MRILVVTNMYPSAAHPHSGIFVEEQTEALRNAGIDVEVMVLPVERSRLHYLLGVFRVFFRTFRRRYAVVHAHYGFTGVASCARWRAPLVTTFHGSDINIPWQRRISVWAARLGTASIFVSERLQRQVPFRPDMYVIPCGVDMSHFRPGDSREARSRLGLPQDKRIIIFPGKKTNPVKGYDLFRRAMAQTGRNDLYELELWGWSRDDMPAVLSAADLLVMTSLQEGSPMVIKEALACNLPVVSVDAGDVGTYIPGMPGCSMAERDPADIAGRMEECLRRDGKSNCREYIADLDNRNIAERLIGVYRSVTGQ